MSELGGEALHRRRRRPGRGAQVGAGDARAMVDLKFCDLLGTWQHMTLPIAAFDESAFDEGLGFDGSSIRGWQGISGVGHAAHAATRRARSSIPFTEAPTLSLVCEIADPITREPYARDPRGVAQTAEEYLRSTGIADTAYFGPECEFFVFDEVSYELGPNRVALRSSTRPRATGTRASRASATRSARRRATSRRRRTTRCTTCARRWC